MTASLGRFGSLLVCLSLTFVIAPFFTDNVSGLSAISVLYTIAIVVGIYAVSGHRRRFYFAIFLAIPALVTEWISSYFVTTPMVIANMVLDGIFIGYVAAVILYEVLDEDHVTLDTIAGGIAVYLLIGMGWVLAYGAIEYLHPGAFLVQDQRLIDIHPEVQVRFPEFIYFSFITLTTLGYGDIVPTTPPARATAAAEAIVGQLYIAIFVARLVGLHLFHHQIRRRKDLL